MAGEALADLFQSGRVAELAVAFLLIEVISVWLFVRHKAATLMRSVVFNALSGLALMLALRAALRGDGWGAVAVFMTLGLFAHLFDLAIRLRSPPKRR